MRGLIPFATGAVCATLLAGGVAVAATHASSESKPTTAKACVTTSGGLALPKKNGKCKKKTSALTVGQGARGPAGPAVAPKVYSVAKPDPTGADIPITGADYTTVLTLSLPAGRYLATQSVEFNTSSGKGFCYLGGTKSTSTIAGGSDILTLSDVPGVSSVSTSAQGVITLTAADSLELACSAGATGSASIQRAVVTALAVGS